MHQELPFEQLVEELQPTRDLSRNPLFQAFFNLLWVDQPSPGEAPEPEVRTMSLDSGTAQFDLALTLWEAGSELAGFLTYSRDLFDVCTIERATRHFRTLVEGILATPERPVGKLPLLAASESQQLLREWNVTAEPLTAATGDQLIATQAAARLAIAGTCVELSRREPSPRR